MDHDDEPRLWVEGGLLGLAPLVGVVLDARHVLLDPRDGLDAVLFGKEPCRHRYIGDKECDADGPGQGCCAEDKEDGLYPSKSTR